MIGIFDPEAIVLGGGMSNTERLYKNLPNIIPKYTFADKVRTKILKINMVTQVVFVVLLGYGIKVFNYFFQKFCYSLFLICLKL